MIRHFATVSLGTLASRASGFLRDAMVAALLGAGAIADIFLIPFQLVSAVRRLIGEGALNAALVPAWLRLRDTEGEEAAAAFAGRVLSVLTLALCALAFVLALAAPLTIALTGHDGRALAIWLMLPYLAFAAPVAVTMAILNAQARFALTAFAPMLFNLLLIAVAAGLLLMRVESATASCALAAAIGVAGVVQLAVLRGSGGARIALSGPTLDRAMRDFLKAAVPGMIATASPQLLMLTGMGFAAAVPGAVSWLYFANRLIELPLGLVGAAMGTVMVPLVARSMDGAGRHERQPFEHHAFEIALGLALPACFALAVLAVPITRVLFQHGAFTADDTLRTAYVLAILALGLPLQVTTKTLAASLFGRGDTRKPMIATLAGVAVTALLAWLSRGVTAIAFAIVAGTLVQAIWLALAQRDAISRPDRDALIRLFKILAASLLMGWALYFAGRLLGDSAGFAVAALKLACLVALGLALYAGLLRLLGLVTAAAVTEALRK